MKRPLVTVLSLAACLLASNVLFAKAPVTKQQLNQVVQKKLQDSSSAMAHKNGVIKIGITVKGEFDQDRIEDTSYVNQECPAVRISNNYLLASAACMNLSGKGVIIHSGGGSGDPTFEKNVPVTRSVTLASVAGVKAAKVVQKDKLILVGVDGKNKTQNAALEKMPIVQLFVAKNPNTLQNVFPELTLNRDAYGIFSGRECAEVDIVNVCTAEGCFKVCWKFIDGDTGDPVFGRNPDKTNAEWLLGFNATNSDVDGRNSGRLYYFLSQSSLDFIKKNMPANEWAKVQSGVRNETLFK